MLNFKKVFNLNIISIALCAAFLFITPLYALSLRIPVGEKVTYDRMDKVLAGGAHFIPQEYLISEVDRDNEELITKILMINAKFETQTELSKNDFRNNVEAIEDGSCGLISMVDSGTSEIIGYVIYRGLGTRAMYLENIFVRPESRRQGVSRLLLEYCQKTFDYIALDNIPSILSAKDGMQRLYERLGFYENRDTGSLVWARYRDKDAPRDFLDILERLEQRLIGSPNTDS